MEIDMEIQKQQPDVKKIYFWNTAGGIVNAMFSVVMVMIITRVTGAYDAGIFSLGYANAMLLQHVGSFDSRSYQCTIRDDKIGFGDFLLFRILTCALMVLVTVFFVWGNGYSWEKALVTLLLSLLCVFNNISDIFQGNAQRNERLDISGKSLTLKTIINIAVFGLILIVFRSIYIACASLIVCTFIWIFIYDIPHNKQFGNIEIRWIKRNLKIIFKATLPLFLSLFFQVYVYNMPKYAIDKFMPVESQTIYGILFMPASVVNLLGNFIFRPILVRLSIMWNSGNYRRVAAMCLKRIAVLGICTIFVVIGGYFLGTPVLSIVYAIDVTGYRNELVVILLGSGFMGVTTLLYYVATVVNKQHMMVVCYIITFILAAGVSMILVRRYELMGAVVCYLCTSVFLNLLITLLIIASVLKLRSSK